MLSRRQARGERSQPLTQRGVQAVGQKGDEDMRLDPGFELVEHRTDGEVAFEGLERLLRLDQPDVVVSQLGRVFRGQIGTQQIAPLAQPGAAEFRAIEAIAERRALDWHIDHDQAPRGWRAGGVDPMAWLTDVLERVVSGQTKTHELHTLLPRNWQPEVRAGSQPLQVAVAA